ncbi:MAG: TetR/AcrR family transcriptional regulator [Prevotella sp.]|nr:TetR/AcrR family transcriptional regulator [Prevotella sp.]
MQEIKDLNAYRISLKDKILDTAHLAFAQRGIRAVKMDDIASSLSISKRTLYEIYGDKESLLFACIRKDIQVRSDYMKDYVANHNVIDVVAEIYRKNVDRLRRTNHLFYLDIQQYPKIVKYIEEEHAHSHEKFISFMHRGVREGYFRKDVNYELISQLFDNIGDFVVKNQLYMQYSYEELMVNLMLVPFRGFCTEKGLKVLNQLKL